MTMSVRSSRGFFFVALLARNDTRFIECMRRMAIFAARRSGVKCCFARCFFVALIASHRRGRFGFVGMRIMARDASLAFGIWMMQFDLRMARATGRSGVFLDIMRRMARCAQRVFFLASPRHGMLVRMARIAGAWRSVGGCVGVVARLTRMPFLKNSVCECSWLLFVMACQATIGGIS